MDSEPFEYTKFPGPRAKAEPEKPRPARVSAPAGAAAVAAVAVVAAVLAAGPLLFPKPEAAPAPEAAARTPVLEEPAPAPVVGSDPGETRPASPLPIAFGAAPKPAPPPVAVQASAPKSAPAKAGPKPFRPPSLKGGAGWGGEKEAGPVAFTADAPPAPEAIAEKASWTAAMRARPITRGALSFPPGKVRPDYAVERSERPDYRVDRTERPDYRVDRTERPDFRLKGARSSTPVSHPRLKAVGGGECVDCEEASDASGIAIGGAMGAGGAAGGGAGSSGGGGGGASIGRLTYVGPCETGQLYRLTNTLGRRLGSTTLIGDSGEVWEVGALQPGESAEIRSRGMISSLSTAP